MFSFNNFFFKQPYSTLTFFFSLLLVLQPIVLITGPALPDIFLSLIALYFLINSFKLKLWHYYLNPVVLGFLIFSFYGILRSLFSDLPLESLTNEGSVFYFRYIFFSMGVWLLLDQNPKLIRWLIISSIFCLVVVSLDGLFQYFNGSNILGFSKHGPDRLTGFFGKEPILGRYITSLSIFTFSMVYQKYSNSKSIIIFSILLLSITDVIVFLTGERASFFCIFLFSILLLIFIPHFRLYRFLGIILSFIIVIGIIEINPSAKKRMIEYSFEQISQTKLNFLPYSKAHEEHYISALKMFYDYPLFGIGTNTFRYQSQKPQYSSKVVDINSHPHNIYLQVLAEQGIFGFFFLASFAFYLIYLGLKQFIYTYFIKKNEKLLPFNYLLYPMVLFVHLWPIIPHMSFYNNWNNVLIMMALGFFLKLSYGKSNFGNILKN